MLEESIDNKNETTAELVRGAVEPSRVRDMRAVPDGYNVKFIRATSGYNANRAVVNEITVHAEIGGVSKKEEGRPVVQRENLGAGSDVQCYHQLVCSPGYDALAYVNGLAFVKSWYLPEVLEVFLEFLFCREHLSLSTFERIYAEERGHLLNIMHRCLEVGAES